MDENGRLNAALFSAYNYLCTDPPIIDVGVTNQPTVPKDTAWNIRRTGEFVVNVVTEDIAQKMNICATDFPAEMREVELAGFTTTPSQKVEASTSCRGTCGIGVPLTGIFQWFVRRQPISALWVREAPAFRLGLSSGWPLPLR